MNALSCLLEDGRIKSIPTCSQKLDEALQHGLRLGTLTEINGSSGAGKTQLCLQLTVNTIIPEPVGFVGGEAVYISTKRNFCKDRVIELIDSCVSRVWETSDVYKSKKNRITFSRNEALTKIHHRLATTLPELVATIYQLQKFAERSRKVRIEDL